MKYAKQFLKVGVGLAVVATLILIIVFMVIAYISGQAMRNSSNYFVENPPQQDFFVPKNVPVAYHQLSADEVNERAIEKLGKTYELSLHHVLNQSQVIAALGNIIDARPAFSDNFTQTGMPNEFWATYTFKLTGEKEIGIIVIKWHENDRLGDIEMSTELYVGGKKEKLGSATFSELTEKSNL